MADYELSNVYTGTVIDTTKMALILSFIFEDKLQFAFAHRSVCFVGDVSMSSMKLRNRIKIGSLVHFLAVLDLTTWRPDVWKVFSAQTESEHSLAFQNGVWDDKFAELYRTGKRFRKWEQLTSTPIQNAEFLDAGVNSKLSSIQFKGLEATRKSSLEEHKDLDDTKTLIGSGKDFNVQVASKQDLSERGKTFTDSPSLPLFVENKPLPVETPSQYSDSSDIYLTTETMKTDPIKIEKGQILIPVNSLYNCTGKIIDVTKKALILSFAFENKTLNAFAHKSVCFKGDYLSANLSKDFQIGSYLNFCAVLDSTTCMPNAWKVVSAWNDMKPSRAFAIEDWKKKVAKIYRKRKWFTKWQNAYSSIESAKVADSDFRSSCTQWEDLEVEHKCIALERKALKHANNIFKESDKNYDLSDELSLLEIFSNVEPRLLRYIKSTYPQISNFFLFHSVVFKISNDMISLNVNKKQFSRYLYVILNAKVEGCCNVGNQMQDILKVNHYNSMNIYSESVTLLFVINVLNMNKHHHWILFVLNSEKLELCLNYFPSTMKTYICEHHNSLAEFITHHSTVFRISKSNQVIPKSKEKVTSYITDILPQLLDEGKVTKPLQIQSQASSSNDLCFDLETAETQPITNERIDSSRNCTLEVDADNYVSEAPQVLSYVDHSDIHVCLSQKESELLKTGVKMKERSTINSCRSLEGLLFWENDVQQAVLTKRVEEEELNIEDTITKDSHSLAVVSVRTSKNASTQTLSTGAILSLAQVITT